MPDAQPREVWLPSTWSAPPIHEVPALVSYLGATPDARSSLTDTDRLQRLLDDLRAREWRRPGPPGAPLLGDRLDVYVAVSRALDEVPWRRFGGRPVRGEPTPTAKAIAGAARGLLAPAVSRRIGDDQLLAAARRHLDVAPWPFDVLR